MTSRFFPAAAATSSLLCLSWLLGAAALTAQTSPPAGTARPAKPKVGHVRFLNLLPLNGGDMVLFGATSANDQPLQIAPPSNFYSTYTGFPPVHTMFRVARRGNPPVVIKSLDVPLRPEGYFTILAQAQANGQPSVDLVDETPDPDKPLTNQLTVRPFFPGVQVVVTAGSIHSNPLNYGEVQVLTNLPDGLVPLTVVATTAAGGPARTLNVDASFQRTRRETVFIVTDAYNRMRPRVVSDGPSRAEEDANLAELRAAATGPANP